MLTRRGMTFLAGGVATYGAGLRLGYDQLLVLGAGALAAVLVAALWVLRGHGLDVDREVAPDRVTRGQRGPDRRSPVRGRLWVRNRRRRLSRRVLAVELINGEPQPVAVLHLSGRDRRSFSYRVPNDRRGVFDVGPVELVRSDPLALWRLVQRAGDVHRLWIHPRQHTLLLRAGQAPSLEGDMGDQAFDGSVTFHRLREYVPGDDLRLVHWPSYARTGDLLVRENVDTGIAQTTILVDTRRAVHDDDGFEEAMEVAASMAVAAAQVGYAARLVTTCGITTLGGPAGRAPTIVLDALAALTPSPDRDLPDRLARLAADRANDVLLAVTGLASPDDLTTLGALARRYRRSSIAVVGAGAARHHVPSALAGRVLRAASGEEFARVWNVRAG